MHNKLQKLNKKYFRGLLTIKGLHVLELPEYSTAVAGIQKEYLGLTLNLYPSFFKLDEKLQEAVLVHELIHIYQFQVLEMTYTEIIEEDKSGHGISFLSKAENILYKYKLDVYTSDYYKSICLQLSEFRERASA